MPSATALRQRQRRIRILALAAIVIAPLAGAGSVEYCVGTSAELRTALASVAADSKDADIKLKRGRYPTEGAPFEFVSISGLELSLIGGYDDGCIVRDRRRGKTVIDGGQVSALLTMASSGNTDIENITFQNGYSATGDSGVKVNDPPGRSSGKITFRYNVVRDNRSGSSNGSGGAIFNAWSVMGYVANNLFVANDGLQVHMPNNYGEFDNNTVIGKGVSKYGVRFPSIRYYEAYNNVIRGHTLFDIAVTTDEHNVGIGPNNFGTYSDFLPFPVSPDPQFAGPDDFHFGATSPLLDAGEINPHAPADSYDLDGHPRVVGVIDIGAFERGDAIFADYFE
jgi:hypothetical protein